MTKLSKIPILPNCQAPNGFCIHNCRLKFCQITQLNSLVREKLKGLKGNLKHKNRALDDTFTKQRRQLYSFYSSSGCGFEAFVTSGGTFVVAAAHKKEFLAGI